MTRPDDEQPYEKTLNDVADAVKETYYGAQIICTWILVSLLIWWPLLVLFDNGKGNLGWYLLLASAWLAGFPSRWVARSILKQ